MKEKRFTIGQEVTPIRKKWVHFAGPPDNGVEPKFGKIYHVSDYDEFYEGMWFIHLKELGEINSFRELSFAPVVSDSVLEQALSEIEETVTI